MSHNIVCPLCEAPMEYVKWNGQKDHETHIWSCHECPGILLEWIDNKDTAGLIQYLYHDPSNPDE